MASRIKGITVEIGGDTTGLEKALKGVNSNIRNTQSSLRDVNTLLKLDPKNTTLLAQKQKLLKEAISETKMKLDSLKDAQEQAKKQLENGELGQDKYDALQREIIKTENDLKKLEEEASKAASKLTTLAEVGTKMENAGEKISSAGKAITPVSAGVTALGAAAVKTTADFDTSMSKVAAVSGAAGDEFDALRDKAREMGAKTKYSASDAADAMNYMAMAGWKTQDMLDGIAGIMNLAAASGEDLALTSDIATDALTAFGLFAKDSTHFADILAAASSNANTNVSMMGETFKYCAPVAGTLGFTAEDTAQAIGLMANAGIKSSQAGTSLRSVMNNLSKDFTISGKKIGEVTIKTQNADGSMRSLNDILADSRKAFAGLTESEKANAAKSLVGKNAMSGFLALMTAAPKDIEKLQSSIENCDGTAESMARTMQDNLTGQLEELSSQVEELAIQFGDAMMPVVRAVVSKVQSLVERLNSMSEGTRNAVLRIGFFVAALGPFLMILGGIITKVGTTIRVFSSLSGSIGSLIAKAGGLSGILSKIGLAVSGISLPMLAVIAVIGTFAAAFIHLWKTNENFRKNILKSWNQIKSAVSTFVQEIKERFSGLSSQFGIIVSAIKKVWELFCITLAPVFEGAFQKMATTLSVVLNVIIGVLDVFIGIFTGNWSQAWNGLKTIVLSVWNPIKEIISKYLNTIKALFLAVYNPIASAWKSLWGNVKSSAVSTWIFIKKNAISIWNGTKNAVLSSAKAMKANLLTNWNQLKASTAAAWNKIKTSMMSPINTAKSKIHAMLKAIKGYFPLKVGRIFSNLKIPKISVSGGKAPFGIGGKGKLPSFDVRWNAEGGIFDAASIIGYGVGEKGKEAIIPLDQFWKQMDMMAKIIIDGVSKVSANSITVEGSRMTIDYDQMANAMVKAMTGISVNSVIELDGRTVARSTAPFMNTEINRLNSRANRKLGTT